VATEPGRRPPAYGGAHWGKILDSLSWVRLTFVDVFGAGHSFQVPARLFLEAVDGGVPFDGSALEGRSRLVEKDMRLKADPGTLRRIDERVGRAVCNVMTADGRPWLGDPRTALQRVVDDLGELAAGYTAGAEMEFYLLDGTRPIDEAGYFNDADSAGISLVREAADQLSAFGVDVDGCHLESGPGQYELDLAPAAPVALADGLVLAKRVIRGVASAAGLRATFMPQPLAGRPARACTCSSGSRASSSRATASSTRRDGPSWRASSTTPAGSRPWRRRPSTPTSALRPAARPRGPWSGRT